MIANYTQYQPEQCDFLEVAESSEVENNGRMLIEVDHLAIAIFRIAGHLFAIGDICSHDDGPLGDGELEEYEIICPRHGARFDVRTGKVISLPAVVDIPAYPVREVSGRIEIGIPKDL